MRTTIAMLFFFFFIAAVVGATPMSTSARLAQLEQQVKVLELKLPSEGSVNLADKSTVTEEGVLEIGVLEFFLDFLCFTDPAC